MSRMKLTPEIIAAATLDAGCASMRAAGRCCWDEEDRIVAYKESERLWAILDATTEEKGEGDR